MSIYAHETACRCGSYTFSDVVDEERVELPHLVVGRRSPCCGSVFWLTRETRLYRYDPLSGHRYWVQPDGSERMLGGPIIRSAARDR